MLIRKRTFPDSRGQHSAFSVQPKRHKNQLIKEIAAILTFDFWSGTN
jgi:hypothetical protein